MNNQAFSDQFYAKLKELVRANNLAAEALTEEQLVEAIRQAILAGDFQRNVSEYGQQVVYIPYREVERLKAKLSILERDMERIADLANTALEL